MTRATRRLSRGRLIVALTFAAAAVGAAQQQGQNTPGAGGGQANFASRFTGKVSVIDSADMRTSRIRFEAGARTNWHLHSTGQLLLVEEGRGRLQEQGGGIKDVPAGQPAYTQPNIPHWHGASPDQAAVQFSVYSGTLQWQQPVTDDEYLGRQK